MSPRLIAVGGPLSGATLTLTDGTTSVGRNDPNVLTLADQSVSPRHCVIACDGRHVTLRDLDRSNPSFVNGLPASDQPLQDGDQIQIGGSSFLLKTSDDGPVGADAVAVDHIPAPAVSTIVMRREDAFAAKHHGPGATSERLSRDLAALIRISAAISAIRGLVALQRPLIELVAEVVPASRGAVVLSGERPTDMASAVGWRRGGGASQPMQLSRSIVERVLADAVGVLSDECSDSVKTARCVSRSITRRVPRNRRMIGPGVVHAEPQKTADGQRVRRPPRDASFRIDPLEVAEQQQPEVAAGRQTRPSHVGRVEAPALLLDEAIEVMGVEQRVQPGVKRMARRLRQVGGREPQRRLLTLSGAHRHARQCKREIDNVDP